MRFPLPCLARDSGGNRIGRRNRIRRGCHHHSGRFFRTRKSNDKNSPLVVLNVSLNGAPTRKSFQSHGISKFSSPQKGDRRMIEKALVLSIALSLLLHPTTHVVVGRIAQRL